MCRGKMSVGTRVAFFPSSRRISMSIVADVWFVHVPYNEFLSIYLILCQYARRERENKSARLMQNRRRRPATKERSTFGTRYLLRSAGKRDARALLDDVFQRKRADGPCLVDRDHHSRIDRSVSIHCTAFFAELCSRCGGKNRYNVSSMSNSPYARLT